MTFGATNAGPLIGPLVLSEIMYHPPEPDRIVRSENLADEYLELHNVTDTAIELSPGPAGTGRQWKLRDAVEFSFPAGAVIAPHGWLLVVSFDPSDAAALDSFRRSHGVPPGIPILGPWQGKLSNAEDGIELVATEPGKGGGPEIVIDRVQYTDRLPWPRTPDGYGAALQRVSTAAFAGDPANWRAAAPSPGWSAPWTGMAPVIVGQSPPMVVEEGSTVRLSIDVPPEPGLAYQWFFNFRPLYQATGPALQFQRVLAGQQGVYHCFVFGSYGGVASSPISLQLTQAVPVAIGIPGLMLTYPPSTNFLTASRQITLTGTATNLGDIAGAFAVWSASGDEVVHVARGTTNWAVTLPLVQGINSIFIRAWDFAGTQSPAIELQIQYSPEASLGLQIVGEGTVTGPTNGQSLAVGASYWFLATPDFGHLFRHWTTPQGTILSTHPLLHFRMVSNLVIQAHFIPDPFPEVTGRYRGLYFDPENPSEQSTGVIHLHAGKGGRFIVGFRNRQGRQTFKGQFGPGLQASLDVTLGSRPTTIWLQLTENGTRLQGTISNAAFTVPVTGVLQATLREGSGTTQYGVEIFDSEKNAADTPLGTGVLSLTRPGHGWLRAKLDGGFQMDPHLIISSDGQALFYAPRPSGKTGFGWLSVSDATPENEVSGSLILIESGTVRRFSLRGNKLTGRPASLRGGSIP